MKLHDEEAADRRQILRMKSFFLRLHSGFEPTRVYLFTLCADRFECQLKNAQLLCAEMFEWARMA